MLSRRQFLKNATLVTVGGATGLGYYAWQIAPHWIETTQFDMRLAGLPPNWIGKRLVQISDLHVGNVVDFEYLVRAIDLTRSYDADVVVITGDFMTCKADEHVDDTIKLVSRLRPDRLPVVVTLGNHDYGARPRRSSLGGVLLNRLHEIGCIALRNTVIELEGLQIGGTDDLWIGSARLANTAAQLDPSRDAILLTHNPDIVDLGGIEMCRGWILAGHTHGGQCNIPFVGPPILPINNPKYAAGLVELGEGRTLYVNRGLGYKEPVRFRCAPEITIFTLLDSPAGATA